MMRILIINPNSDEQTHELLKAEAQRFLNGRAKADVISLKTAPRLVVTFEDQASSTAELIEVMKAKREEYDGFVIACHGDPGLDLVREMAGGRPVWGIGQASMRMASAGGGFAVITPSAGIIIKKRALARKYYCEDQLREIVVSRGNTADDLLEAGKKALENSAVQALVLGCANYAGKAAILEQELRVPVMDGLICALALTEAELQIREYLYH